jgi:head-tail adaptor
MRGRQVEAHIQAVVRMRHRTTITSEMRLVVLSGPNSGKTLNIASVFTVDRRGLGAVPELELHCIA